MDCNASVIRPPKDDTSASTMLMKGQNYSSVAVAPAALSQDSIFDCIGSVIGHHDPAQHNFYYEVVKDSCQFTTVAQISDGAPQSYVHHLSQKLDHAFGHQNKVAFSKKGQ